MTVCMTYYFLTLMLPKRRCFINDKSKQIKDGLLWNKIVSSKQLPSKFQDKVDLVQIYISEHLFTHQNKRSGSKKARLLAKRAIVNTIRDISAWAWS